MTAPASVSFRLCLGAALLVACGERPANPETNLRYAFVKERAFAEDAGAAWALTSNDEVVFDDGWHARESERKTGIHGPAWRWMGRSAVIRLRRSGKARTMSLIGWVPIELTGTPPTMTIRIDGLPVDTFIPPLGEFERIVTLPATTRPGFWDIELQTSTVGTERGDPRELGYALARTSLKDSEAPK